MEYQTEGYIHEVLDRSALLSSNIEDFIINHPTVANNPELLTIATRAGEAMAELYQAAGNLMELTPEQR